MKPLNTANTANKQDQDLQQLQTESKEIISDLLKSHQSQQLKKKEKQRKFSKKRTDDSPSKTFTPLTPKEIKPRKLKAQRSQRKLPNTQDEQPNLDIEFENKLLDFDDLWEQDSYLLNQNNQLENNQEINGWQCNDSLTKKYRRANSQNNQLLSSNEINSIKLSQPSQIMPKSQEKERILENKNIYPSYNIKCPQMEPAPQKFVTKNLLSQQSELKNVNVIKQNNIMKLFLQNNNVKMNQSNQSQKTIFRYPKLKDWIPTEQRINSKNKYSICESQLKTIMSAKKS